jgi:hypothetical protein
MPLDHYVSQVRLKQFNSPALDGLMHAIRKTDLKRFPARSRDVCRIEDGGTNASKKTEQSRSFSGALEGWKAGAIGEHEPGTRVLDTFRRKSACQRDSARQGPCGFIVDPENAVQLIRRHAHPYQIDRLQDFM